MSQTTMIAMLEEAEDVLRRAGCDMTADKVRGVLQEQQAEPRCACGDSFTSDAVCVNCLCAQQQAVAVPDGYALVPAVATDHMTWVGQSMRYDREISIGAIYAAMLAAAPQGAVAAPLPPYNVFSDDDGDSWREHPADADFVEGLQLGDEFELLAGWRPVRVTFRVTKVPDDESDDYEVEEVTAPAAAQKGGA